MNLLEANKMLLVEIDTELHAAEADIRNTIRRRFEIFNRLAGALAANQLVAGIPGPVEYMQYTHPDQFVQDLVLQRKLLDRALKLRGPMVIR